MLCLVTGGSASGKSAWAEGLCMKLAKGKKLYIATMQPYGEEGERRIRRHHRLRAGKRFETLECYTGLETVRIGRYSCILLECMSNLTANEMFAPEGRKDRAAEKILEGVRHLQTFTDHLVIVTNEVFSDGIVYPEETMNYQQELARINRELAAMADVFTEIVCGIPVMVKGETV